ncbi:MAG TPA: NADH-ubiquinone oxidoreductase-F iron-sulfur binding region domain-containing protein [Pseudomonadales bacterium]|nr:NADH-ubiquinone oxidoreductase-F iron-sulfur binding region domain-containing protein [Pseudomonadales bacterium]
MSVNISKLSGRKGLDDNLFQRITAFGDEHSVPDSGQLDAIAKEYLVGKATVAGSQSFYDFLSEEHLGKQAFVCNGSACLCAGTQQQVHDVLSAKFGADNIGHITCLGRCHENASFQLHGKNYSGVAIEKLDAILQDSAVHQQDNYHVEAVGAALLTAPFADISLFKAQLQKVFLDGADVVLEEIKVSKLRGRGGAGFPTGMKWESCKNVPGDEKYIVCNADEGDPGAYSDRYLLEYQPLRVLFGMMVAGFIAGSKNGVLYIRAEYPEAIEKTQQAIDLLRQHKILGKNILDSGFDFEFKVIKGAGAYICGEETALLASIEGRRPEVDIRPPFPTVEGLYKKPTILNNVETFAVIPALLDMAGSAYSVSGGVQSSGTKLLSLDGLFNRPGLYEVPMGYPLRKVIDELGKGFRVPVKALHIGGPLGGLVPVSKIDDLTVDFETFAKHGFLLGHGSIVCVPESFPVIAYMEHLFAFTATESCGKCFPCRLGSTRGKEMLQRAITGEQKLDRKLIGDLLDTLQSGSLCALGGGLPLPIRNALQYFSDELKSYFIN